MSKLIKELMESGEYNIIELPEPVYELLLKDAKKWRQYGDEIERLLIRVSLDNNFVDNTTRELLLAAKHEIVELRRLLEEREDV